MSELLLYNKKLVKAIRVYMLQGYFGGDHIKRKLFAREHTGFMSVVWMKKSTFKKSVAELSLMMGKNLKLFPNEVMTW